MVTTLLYGPIIAFLFCIGFCMLFPIGSILQKLSIATAFAFVGLGRIVPEEAMILQSIYSFFVGVMASLNLIIMLSAASSLGELIEAGRGMTTGAIVDPHVEFPEMPLGVLLRWYALFILTSLTGVFDGQLLLLNESFDAVFRYDEINSMLFDINERYLSILAISITFFISYLCIELFCGSLSKIIPNLSLYAESFLLKAGLSYVLGITLIRVFHNVIGA